MRWIQLTLIGVLTCLVISLTPHVTLARTDCTPAEAQAIRENPNDSAEYLGTVMYSGTIKTNGQYDGVVVGYVRGSFRFCKRYETGSGINSEVTKLDEWGGRVFATILTNGGNQELDSYTEQGWIPDYGTARGPQVAVIAEIDPVNHGEVLKGTYVISKTEDGQTNSVVIDGVQFYDFRVHITGVASSYVLRKDGSIFDYVECPRGSGFKYTLDYDMTQLLDVECNGVTMRSEGVLRNTGEIPEDLPDPINPGGGFFAYCTPDGGIDVYGASGGVGYELFGVPNYTIGNGLAQAVETGENVKLGEAGIVSLWALNTDELQLHTSEPYDFIFSKYRCGDPVVTGEPVTVSTSSNPPPIAFANEPVNDYDPIPESASNLPVYNPSPIKLNNDGTYTVRSGDTLNTIATKLGIDVKALAEANRIINTRYIVVGQILKIPTGDE